ncbi:MAG: hypothetical protein RSA01_00515 [Clostridium sp.]|uniref:hypothetical protein n=1 Tax=Clostridium sp. TaxID=1506 RepID=UPI002FCC1932
MEVDIINFIESSIPSLRNRIYPIFTTEARETSVTYLFKPINGGHVLQSQLELRVIGLYYDEVKELERILIDLLDIEDNKASIAYGTTYFRSSLSGGGILFRDDLQMYEDILYFTIRWRCK